MQQDEWFKVVKLNLKSISRANSLLDLPTMKGEQNENL
jgi:hypothetical protein